MPGSERAGGLFVGRADEVAQLDAVVGAALRGEGSGALIVGEPGVGKTRLATEVAARARATGVRLAWASAWEPGLPQTAPGRPAGYWHWGQILRSLAAGRDRRELLDDLGAASGELARLVPDLRAGVRLSLPDPPQGDDPRFRMYDAVASFLRTALRHQPVLLVFDDLHGADRGSLSLLSFVLAETRLEPLAVLAAARDVEAGEVGDALAGVSRALETVRLAGLDAAAVEDLLRGIVGDGDAARLAPEVRRRSGGNPLFVRELGRLLADDATGLAGRLPAGIRALVERRLSAVSPASVGVLRAAAVVGEEFTVPLVEDAAACERGDVIGALDDAAAARLVAERPDHGFAFVHALVRDVLYDQLPLAERARAHRRVAEGLERRGGAATPAELARHFLAASVAVEDGKAAHWAEAAGRQADGQLAYEDAAGHYLSALGALGLTGADPSRRIPLLLALGEARLRSGDIDAAREAFVEAAGHAREEAEPELFARAALGLGSGLDGFEVRLFDHAQITLLNEALDLLGPAPSALRAWAMARLSVAVTFAEGADVRLRLADGAVAMARQVGDDRALAYALAACCDATAGPEHVDQRRAAASEIARLAEASGDRGMELLGRRNRVIALLESGDIPGVDAEIDRYELVASAIGQPLYQWYVPLWRGMRALMEGRIDAARRLQADAAAVGMRARSHNAALNAEVLAWNTLLKEGRWREAADRLERQLALADGIYGEPFWVAIVTPHLHRAEGRAALDRLAARNFDELPRDAVWLAAMTYASDTCGALGYAGVAEQLYDLVRPHASRFAVDAIGAACYGSMSRPLGVLATVLGRYGDAEAYLADALDAHRAAGASALVAETMHDLGLAAAAAGATSRAEAALGEARDLYLALGMDHRAGLVDGAPLVRSVPERRARSGALTGNAVAGGDNVFRREGDYWTLAYRGRTVRVADAKGLHDLAALLARPDRELHVADLIAATDPARDRVSARARAAVLGGSRSGPVLDDRARATYRARLLELRADLEEAEAGADLGRAEAARTAMDAVAAELAASLGLGGGSRTHADAAERARKAVTQRIRNSIRRLEAVHPELAAHLDRSVRTGRFCSYRPEQPTTWLR